MTACPCLPPTCTGIRVTSLAQGNLLRKTVWFDSGGKHRLAPSLWMDRRVEMVIVYSSDQTYWPWVASCNMHFVGLGSDRILPPPLRPQGMYCGDIINICCLMLLHYRWNEFKCPFYSARWPITCKCDNLYRKMYDTVMRCLL